jgi:hypothetical protein
VFLNCIQVLDYISNLDLKIPIARLLSRPGVVEAPSPYRHVPRAVSYDILAAVNESCDRAGRQRHPVAFAEISEIGWIGLQGPCRWPTSIGVDTMTGSTIV